MGMGGQGSTLFLLASAQLAGLNPTVPQRQLSWLGWIQLQLSWLGWIQLCHRGSSAGWVESNCSSTGWVESNWATEAAQLAGFNLSYHIPPPSTDDVCRPRHLPPFLSHGQPWWHCSHTLPSPRNTLSKCGKSTKHCKMASRKTTGCNMKPLSILRYKQNFIMHAYACILVALLA